MCFKPGARGGEPLWIRALLKGTGVLAAAALAACSDTSLAEAPTDLDCPQLEARSGDPDGLIFIGLSLSRNFLELAAPAEKAATSNNASVSRQTQFDFNHIQDRNYDYFCSTNDDGWLVAGGEGPGDYSGSSPSFKLPNPDSAHIEVLHVGNGDPSRGGLSEEEIVAIMQTVDFAPIPLKPSYVRLNDDSPPEYELRFQPEDNPELYALYETLLEKFRNPTREAGDPFHMSITRKVEFRSASLRDAWLEQSDAVVDRWRAQYPDGVILTPDPAELERGAVTPEEVSVPGGVYLFWNRNLLRRYFPPTR